MLRSDAATAAAHLFSTVLGATMLVQLASLPAFAEDAAPGGSPSPILQFVPILVMIVVMYFLMIRPQSTRAKAHQQFVAGLKRGEEVVTASGILGRIEGLTDIFVTLEIAPGVRIKILRGQIATAANAAVNATTKEVST